MKNTTDSTFVSFKYDESGNVGEEIWKRGSRITETYYYYYNDKQKITDIVRFNKKAKRMLPDFIIEYDEKGRVAQMTQSQSGSANYLVWRYQYNPQGLKDKDATYYKINRGGDITYHGPGQIVGYPILDLDNFFTDIHLYLRTLEEAVILTLKDYGIESGRYPGYTGVWLDPDNENARKICAMGVRCSRWVTMHGFAFNVNVDLDYFKNIVPCGIDDKAVTSLQKELGYQLDMNEVKVRLKNHIAQLFKMELI
ncbi:MAG: lipoyl(octanoyl) transferase LipB [Sphingobacteriales bacterium]|nr:MAG: lipoyl(octanoyl) transferase LipB [Sphingobacteriales bacterium]